MAVNPITVKLEVETNSDLANLDETTRRLLNELNDLNVESVMLAEGAEVQKGAKSAEAVTIGALMLVVLPAALPHLIDFLRDWAARDNNRTVKIKRQEGDSSIEVEYNMKNISEDEIKHMITVLGGVLKKDNNV